MTSLSSPTSRKAVNRGNGNLSDDMFKRQDEALKRLKNLGTDVWGNPEPKVPCDNLETFQFTDCETCPKKKQCDDDLAGVRKR